MARPSTTWRGAVGVSAVFLDAADEATRSSAQPDARVPEADEPDEADGAEEPDEAEQPDERRPVDEPEATTRTEHENADTRLLTVVPEPAAPDLFADAADDPATVAGPTVQAVICSWGHPNPPGAERCRVCTGLIAAQPPRAVPTPVLAVLRASTGQTVDLVGSVLVGRAPARDRARVEDPVLLTVTSPSHDISRTHLEVFGSGWDVGVTDLHSTNGTVLVAPDGSIRTMGSGETAVVELGTSLELAEGISVLIDFPQ